MSIPDPTPPEPQNELPLMTERRSLSDWLGDLTFKEYVAKVRDGLRHPKDSGEYKFAMHQVLRVWSPIAGVVLPVLLVFAVMLSPTKTQSAAGEFQVTVLEASAVEELDDIQEIEKPEPPPEEYTPPPLENFTPEQIQNMTDEQLVGGAIGPNVGPGSGPSAPGADGAFSPQPAAFDSVSMIKSPIRMSGIYGSRTPGARGSALARYGGGGGGGAGGAATEHAVYLALRWLKKYQEPDGRWTQASGGGPGSGADPAMTGLALLTYLAHGETPASEEFGPTVERAIKWLVDNETPEGEFKNADGNNYSQPIAAYALSEAFALTRIPMVKTAAERAITRIVKGQNPEGLLWNYSFNPKSHLQAGAAGDRNDLSFAAWCMQALKAAGMAGLEVEGLEESKKKAVQGIRMSAYTAADGTTGFAYSRVGKTGGGQDNITSAGTLCLQLLGAGKSREANQAVLWLKRADCVWDKPWTDNPLYHWYYITQVKFHAGGAVWTDWNKQFSPQLVRNQIVVKSAIQDTKGNLVDIGYWKAAAPGEGGKGGEHSKSYVYNTTLCSLMLQVYYRYLPTYQPPADTEDAPTGLQDENKDVDIEVL